MAQIGEFYDIKTAAADDQSAAAQCLDLTINFRLYYTKKLYKVQAFC